MTPDFRTLQDDAETRLAELRRKRGAAVLDGRPLDAIEIAATEAELDALAEAEAEQIRRQREAEAARIAALQKVLSAELRDREKARLHLVAQAEAAARELSASLTGVFAAAEAERSTIKRMGKPVPPVLGDEPLARRLGERLAATLSTFRTYPPRLGPSVVWGSTPSWVDPAASWPDAERRELAPHFQPFEDN